MPIRATANGNDFIAPLMDDAQWAELRRAVKAKRLNLTMPCCGATGFPREPQSGTRHFYHHDKATCDWKPETIDHIAIKSEIAIACKEIGRPVIPEFRGSGWRADVLTHGGAADPPQPSIAFEIQWSRQNLEVTKTRQAKYTTAGVHCFWFFKTMPKPLDRGWPAWREEFIGEGRNPLPDFHESDSNHLVKQELPIFQITKDAQRGYLIHLGYGLRRLPLREFVRHLLQGRIVFRPYVRVQRDDRDDSLDDFAFYNSRCGSEACRNESIRGWNHWCFGEGQEFCPLHRTQPVKQDLSATWREEFRLPPVRAEGWWNED